MPLEHQSAQRIFSALRDCAARSECPHELSRDFVATLRDALPQASTISIEWIEETSGDTSPSSIRHETSLASGNSGGINPRLASIPSRLKKRALEENEDVYAPHTVGESVPANDSGSHHISLIRKGPNVVGLLCLASDEARAFSADERCVLRAVADSFGGLLRDEERADHGKPSETLSVQREA